MRKYFETHKDELKNAKEVVEDLYDEIRFNIADLQILKHIIREMYQRDEKLMQEGLPPKIGHDLEAGVKHTQQEVNELLKNLGMMFGELTRIEN
jgi:hypothetical protein